MAGFAIEVANFTAHERVFQVMAHFTTDNMTLGGDRTGLRPAPLPAISRGTLELAVAAAGHPPQRKTRSACQEPVPLAMSRYLCMVRTRSSWPCRRSRAPIARQRSALTARLSAAGMTPPRCLTVRR